MGANRSQSLFCKERLERRPHGRSFAMSKLSESHKVGFLRQERQERFAHGGPFLKRDESESLTVPLYHERF